MERIEEEALAGVLELDFHHIAPFGCAGNIGHPVVARQFASGGLMMLASSASAQAKLHIGAGLRVVQVLLLMAVHRLFGFYI